MDIFEVLINILRWIWETLIRFSKPLFKSFGDFLFSFIATEIGWSCFWVLLGFIFLNLAHIKISPKTKWEFLLFFVIYCGTVWVLYSTNLGTINRYAGLPVVGNTMVVLGSFRFFFDPIYKFFLSIIPKPKPQKPA